MTVPVQAIHTLLRSPEVRGINFAYTDANTNPIHSITGHKFFELSNLFADQYVPHRIRVTTNSAIVGPQGSRTFASYDADEDKINVRSSNVLDTIYGRSCFLHECVHAIQDWRGIDMRTQVAEAMAYIAQTWYLLIAGGPLDDMSAPMIEVTREIMGSYSAHYLHPATLIVSPVSMTREQYFRVRQSVLDDYGYRTGFYDNNGIRGGRRRDWRM
jgi:hypothetical protein